MAAGYDEGAAAFIRGDYESAWREWLTLGERGHQSAQYNLGVLYSIGLGVDQNDGEASKWFRRAADRGLPAAQMRLGTAYVEGRGVPENLQEAYFWFTLAATHFSLGQQHEQAVAARESTGAALTRAQITEVLERAMSWKPLPQTVDESDKERLIAEPNAGTTLVIGGNGTSSGTASQSTAQATAQSTGGTQSGSGATETQLAELSDSGSDAQMAVAEPAAEEAMTEEAMTEEAMTEEAMAEEVEEMAAAAETQATETEAEEAVQEPAEEMAQETAGEMAEEMAEETAPEMAQEMAPETAPEMAEETASATAEATSEATTSTTTETTQVAAAPAVESDATLETAETPEAPETTVASESFAAHLSSVRSEDGTTQEWQSLRGQFAGLLDDRTLTVRSIATDDGTFYRVMAGSFDDEAAARAFCGQIKASNPAKDPYCVVRRLDGGTQ